MDKAFTYFENTIEKIMHLLEVMIDAFSHGVHKLVRHGEKMINWLMDSIYSKLVMELYGLFRWTTIPLNWIIPNAWFWWIFRPFEKKPYLIQGLHYWTGPPRAGKSLASYCIAEEIRREFGLCAYFTSPVEKPRLSEDGKYWYVYHALIDLNKVYVKGQKKFNFVSEKYPVIFKDENSAEQNPRMNKTREYNWRFIPERIDENLMAHEGMTFGVHIMSQQKKTDGQRMETITIYHEIEKTVKGIHYGKWIKDGKFEIVPKYIKVSAYKIDFVWNQNAKRKLYRRYRIKVPYENLPYYETLAESKRFAHLPDYKI